MTNEKESATPHCHWQPLPASCHVSFCVFCESHPGGRGGNKNNPLHFGILVASKTTRMQYTFLRNEVPTPSTAGEHLTILGLLGAAVARLGQQAKVNQRLQGDTLWEKKLAQAVMRHSQAASALVAQKAVSAVMGSCPRAAGLASEASETAVLWAEVGCTAIC